MTGRQVRWERFRLEVVRAINLQGHGKLAEAYETLRAAHHIGAELYGEDHPSVLSSTFNEGAELVKLKRLDEATAFFTDYEAKIRKIGGDEHPLLGKTANYLGIIAEDRGDLEGAIAAYRRSLELKIKNYGADSVSAAYTQSNIGGCLVLLHRPEEALPELRAAFATLELRLGKGNEASAETSTQIGLALLQLGRPAEALPNLEAAVTIRAAAKSDKTGLAQSRFGLARALWDTDRARARTLIAEARPDSDEQPAIDAWLAAHR
jgi:tetratricopeptide (TPR) repeat protein